MDRAAYDRYCTNSNRLHYYTRLERAEQRKEEARKQRNYNIRFFAIAVGLALAFLTAVVLISTSENSVYNYSQTEEYYVNRGETLWSIAKQYSDNRHDTRKVVFEIEKLSNTSALLQDGQILVVPLYDCLQGGK